MTTTTLAPTEATDEPAPTEIPEVQIRRRGVRAADVVDLIGSAVGSFCLTWLAYESVTPLSGGLGFMVTWYVLFLVTAWLAARERVGPVQARDRLASLMVGTIALAMLVPLGIIVGTTVARGFQAFRPNFFTQDQSGVGPLSPPTAGGGSAAIVGSLEMIAIATLLSVPLGIATAVFLSEIRGVLARPVRMIVDAMSAIPSIVAGLFIYAAFILAGHQQQSGFAAALALTVIMLPTVTRSTAEVVLRLVPGGLREASFALGGGEWATVRRVILPTARTGLLTAVILGIARVAGDTAALILTALGNSSFNSNPLHGKQDALPIFVYRLINFPQAAERQRAWTGAMVLLGLVLVLFVIARIIGGRSTGHIGRIKRWRLARRGLA